MQRCLREFMLEQAILSNPVDKFPHQLGWMNPLRDDSQGCEGSDVAYFGSHLGWISPPGVVAVPSASRAGEAGVCCGSGVVEVLLGCMLFNWFVVVLVVCLFGRTWKCHVQPSGINHDTSAA